MSDLLLRRPPDLTDALVARFAELVLSEAHGVAALEIERLMADGLSPRRLMLELLAPAARLLGQMWCEDEASFFDVTLGVGRLQRMLRQITAAAPRPPRRRGAALLAPAPGEQHGFGLRVVEELLLLEGWQVRAPASARDFDPAQLAAVEEFDIVGFSISAERLLPALRRAIAEIRAASRNRGVRIIVGGVLFSGHNSSEIKVDADATAADALAAVARANEWYAVRGGSS